MKFKNRTKSISFITTASLPLVVGSVIFMFVFLIFL